MERIAISFEDCNVLNAFRILGHDGHTKTRWKSMQIKTINEHLLKSNKIAERNIESPRELMTMNEN